MRLYILGFLIFCASYSSAQVLTQFNGLFNIQQITDMGNNQYQIKGIFSDQGNIFQASGAMAGDRIIDNTGSMFEVISLVTSSQEVDAVTKNLGTRPPSLGDGMLYRPSTKGFPLITNSAMMNVLTTAQNTAVLAIDKSIPNYNSGSSLPQSSSKLWDVVLNTSDSKVYRLEQGGWVTVDNIPFVFGFPANANQGDVIYYGIDDKNYVFNGASWELLKELSALPTSAKFGDVFFVEGEKKLYMMSKDGDWAPISSMSIPGGGDTELPANPKPGDLFFNTDLNKLYVYENNGKWVVISMNGSSPTGTVNPDPATNIVNEGEVFYNTADHKLYVYNGTTWVSLDNTLRNGHIFVGNASNVAVSVPLSGDATVSTTGKLTIKDLAITDEKLDKTNIPLSGFANPFDHVSMGDGVSNFKITNLANPSVGSDATTKSYVDALFSNPASLVLTNNHFFVGNSSNKAVGVDKKNIPISGFDKAFANVSMGTGLAGGNFKIINMADPSAAQDAATKNYVDTRVITPGNLNLPKGNMFVGNDISTATATAKNLIPLSGFGEATTDIAIGGFKLMGLAEPFADNDAATKKYVDNKIINPAKINLTNGNLFVGDANGKAADVLKNTIPLSGFGDATADISIGGFLLTNVATPIADADASNKKYVDDLFKSPSVILALAKDNMFLGDAQGKAIATPKKNIAISGFAKAADNIYMGDAAQRFNISELADPIFEQDAATKNYVDSRTSTPGSLDLPTDHILVGDANNKAVAVAKNAVPVSDFGTATADVVMGDGTANFKIINLADPVSDQEAATKKYVDASITAATSSTPVGKDNLGNHIATENIKLSVFAISNKGNDGEGLSFDAQGNANLGQDLTVNGNLYTPSDRNLKTHIETLTTVLQKIDQIRGVSFEYKDQRKYAVGVKIGVIAQELQTVYPEMVTKGKDGFLKVDYTQLTGMLIQAVKEQQKEIDALKVRMDKQQEQINSILKKMQ
ncbi:tail fiber domain-containing protein [Pedobacter nyackensis]|uniref:tail fiber domain-containing protein n=1 Tax=Pedobacter nyackensis TaxID=475255 RepID=UPI00292E2B5C|nr:tail fiber domain-containing protein [Pedobacter nyackensis]